MPNFQGKGKLHGNEWDWWENERSWGGSLPSPWSGGSQDSCGRRCRKISLWAEVAGTFAWGAGQQGDCWWGLAWGLRSEEYLSNVFWCLCGDGSELGTDIYGVVSVCQLMCQVSRQGSATDQVRKKVWDDVCCVWETLKITANSFAPGWVWGDSAESRRVMLTKLWQDLAL